MNLPVLCPIKQVGKHHLEVSTIKNHNEKKAMNICTAYFPTITYFFAPCWPIVNYGFYLKQQFPAIVQLLSETVAQSIDTCYLKYHPQPLFPYYSKPQPQSPCTLVT